MDTLRALRELPGYPWQCVLLVFICVHQTERQISFFPLHPSLSVPEQSSSVYPSANIVSATGLRGRQPPCFSLHAATAVLTISL